MTRKNKLTILVIYLICLCIIMLAYRIDRTKKMKRLRAAIAQVEADRDRVRAVEAEVDRLSRLIPVEAGVPAFVEELYRCAKESGLRLHEVVTETDKEKKPVATRSGTAVEIEAVSTHRLKISAAGSFRQLSEYVRRVQNIERFNRITDFKMSPDGGQVKGAFTVELFSLPVKR
ncbi:MAG TPA: type 4a pilus biogenesis protein PilO [Desulfuromonadales bacterium]|nr:type 4a pilus biogenesis protein PilO [Desulfuromonadales bacterium]